MLLMDAFFLFLYSVGGNAGGSLYSESGYLGCLGLTNQELQKSWIFPGTPPNCQYVHYDGSSYSGSCTGSCSDGGNSESYSGSSWSGSGGEASSNTDSNAQSSSETGQADNSQVKDDGGDLSDVSSDTESSQSSGSGGSSWPTWGLSWPWQSSGGHASSSSNSSSSSSSSSSGSDIGDMPYTYNNRSGSSTSTSSTSSSSASSGNSKTGRGSNSYSAQGSQVVSNENFPNTNNNSSYSGYEGGSNGATNNNGNDGNSKSSNSGSSYGNSYGSGSSSSNNNNNGNTNSNNGGGSSNSGTSNGHNYFNNGANDDMKYNYYSNSGNGNNKNNNNGGKGNNNGANSNNNNNGGNSNSYAANSNGGNNGGGNAVAASNAANGNGQTTYNPYADFNITQCDTYSNLWLWDLSLTCQNENSLANCSCPFASHLMAAGKLSCSDARNCPTNCKICFTCMQLLGCAVSKASGSTAMVRTSSYIYILEGVAGFLLFSVFAYIVLRSRRSSHGLDAHLMHDEEDFGAMTPDLRRETASSCSGPGAPLTALDLQGTPNHTFSTGSDDPLINDLPVWLAPDAPPVQFEPSTRAAIESDGESSSSHMTSTLESRSIARGGFSSEAETSYASTTGESTIQGGDGGVWLAPVT